jgi:hypothetical protein
MSLGRSSLAIPSISTAAPVTGRSRPEHHIGTRDFNDQPVPPITGSDGRAGGSPVLGSPSGPKPSLDGAAEPPQRVIEDAAPLASGALRVPV